MTRPAEHMPDAARFEAMLQAVLTTAEEAHARRSAKDRRTVALHRAERAKARFELGRERGPKSPRGRTGRSG